MAMDTVEKRQRGRPRSFNAPADAGAVGRTAARPIQRGRVTADEALSFGVVLSIFSVMTHSRDSRAIFGNS